MVLRWHHKHGAVYGAIFPMPKIKECHSLFTKHLTAREKKRQEKNRFEGQTSVEAALSDPHTALLRSKYQIAAGLTWNAYGRCLGTVSPTVVLGNWLLLLHAVSILSHRF